MKDEIKKEVIKKIDVNSGNVVTILEGSAPTQHNLQTVNMAGNIESASRFLKVREGEFDPKKAHCLVSVEDGTVDLIINEQDACDTYVVFGKLELSKVFTELGINTGKRYNALKLAETFRLKRSIFESWDEHANICATLKNLKAKINREVDDAKNDNGDRNYRFQQSVDSNMPSSFKLHLPLIKGGDKETIEVNVVIEASGNDITCHLVSVDGQEKIDNAFETKVVEQAKIIEETVLVIYK